MPDFITVAKTGEIPNGEGRAFEVNNQMVAVFNNNGDYLAIDDMCPHMGASLASGHFEPHDCTVTCPWHGWRFDTRDGTWCDNRRLKIDAYQVRVVGEEIQVAPAEPEQENENEPAAAKSLPASFANRDPADDKNDVRSTRLEACWGRR